MSPDEPPRPPRLRGNAKPPDSLYPLGEFPDDIVFKLGRQIVHRLAIGQANISGDDFGTIFAKAIGGKHLAKPIGVTDVVLNSTSWSVKTVQSTKPFSQQTVRLITGRNSPNFSYGMKDPHEDIQATGSAVLRIWNRRVDLSRKEYDDLRVLVLVRDMSTLQFNLFEYEAAKYPPADFEWRYSKQENLMGFEKGTKNHRFTWQFHGSQFTVIRKIPGSAIKFRIIKNPGIVSAEDVLRIIGFQETWIERVN